MKRKIKLDEFKVTSFVTEIKDEQTAKTVKGGSGHWLHCSRICQPSPTEGVLCDTFYYCETDEYGYCEIP